MPLGAARINSLARYIAPVSFDRPIQVTAFGSAQITTAEKQFGTGSLVAGASGGLNAEMLLPSGDFTIEHWGRITNRSDNSGHWEIKAESHTIYVIGGEVGGSVRNIGLIITDVNGTSLLNFASAGSSFPDNTWRHVAVVRDGTTIRFFLNGVQIHSSTISSFSMPDTNTLKIGNAINKHMRGQIDEFRVSNVARYTAAFTPPTAAFTNDSDTLLLLHMDGDNNSTVFTDDNS